MSRSAFTPYAIPLALVCASSVLWLYICGGFSVLQDLLTSVLSFII